MTIAEAISRVDEIKPNRFTQKQKIEWLENIEGQIYQEMVLPNENPGKICFDGFPADVDVGTKLIAPAPYDEVYVLYLQCRIDLGNAELKKYNNSMLMFNSAYATLKDWWKRAHRPVERVTHFIY
ncbi:MAG: hypothetical protein J6M10_03670 [Clostridia bacterium]|nr:hypothetical protein [Clostridia bacterium]